MNILILNAGRGWGGIESHSTTLSLALRRRGHRTIIACSEGGHVHQNAVQGGLPVDNIRVRNACDPISILKIMRLASKEKIDIIVANLGKEYWPAAVAARLLGRKIVFIRHQTDRIRSTTRWLIHNHVSAVVAVSSAVKKALIASGIKDDKIAVVPNSISLARFNPSLIDREQIRRELGVAGSDLLVGTIGKLHEGKGVYELLDAAVAIAAEGWPIKVIFVGDGPEKEGLEKRAEKRGMRGRAIFTGVRRDVERLYAAMDVFVLPSTCSEAFGMVIIEAMAMGKPVIGTEVGGIPELISDGRNGLLIPPGNAKALAAAIRKCMADRDLAARIAAGGRLTVESQFSEDALGERFEEVLERLGKTR